VAAKRTAITRGELLVTALNALGPHIGISTETTMASAFAIITGLAVCFAVLGRLGRGGICGFARLVI
jgi:hypothetical protein